MKTVRFWTRGHSLHGSVKALKPTGRPRLLSTAARSRALELLLDREVGGARFVAQALLAEKHVSKLVSVETVLRAARSEAESMGKKLTCHRGRPLKVLTAANKEQRVRFALANKARSWSHVMFTDRKKIDFRYPGCSVRSHRWVLGSQDAR